MFFFPWSHRVALTAYKSKFRTKKKNATMEITVSVCNSFRLKRFRNDEDPFTAQNRWKQANFSRDYRRGTEAMGLFIWSQIKFSLNKSVFWERPFSTGNPFRGQIYLKLA